MSVQLGFGDYVRLEMIRATTARVSLDDSDMAKVLEYLKLCASKGRDLRPSPMMATGAEGYGPRLRDGLLILTSPEMLKTDILYVKINAGKGLFGGQKASFASYLGQVEADEWLPGTTFNGLLTAITSITNLYEAEGYR